MFPFDNLQDCEVTETPFTYNGAKGMNVCVRMGRQEVNYEYMIYEEYPKEDWREQSEI